MYLTAPLRWPYALGFLGQLRIILGMAPLVEVLFPCCSQLFDRILANHFEHPVAWESVSHGLHLNEAGIDESLDGRKPVIGSEGFLALTDGLGCCKLAASYKYGQRTEPALLRGCQQVVAPADRFTHRSLA